MMPEMMPMGTARRAICASRQAPSSAAFAAAGMAAATSAGTDINALAPSLVTRKHTTPARGAAPLPSRANRRHADGKQQAQMREHRIARRADKAQIEQIRLAQSQQQRRHRQHRDGQHQGPPRFCIPSAKTFTAPTP
jgi:hypothetical protein